MLMYALSWQHCPISQGPALVVSGGAAFSCHIVINRRVASACAISGEAQMGTATLPCVSALSLVPPAKPSTLAHTAPAVSTSAIRRPAALHGAPAGCGVRQQAAWPSFLSGRQLPRQRHGAWRQQQSAKVCTTVVAAVSNMTGEGLGGGWVDADAEPQTESQLQAFAYRLRAIAFYVVSLTSACVLFAMMVVATPLTLLLDKYRRRFLHFCNDTWAFVSTAPFMRVDVQGAENLPRPDEAAVYVANHQSYLDIYSLFRLWRPFKFISKTSNFLIPIIGWSMYLTGHVPLKRLDKRSQMECLRKCEELLNNGSSVLFFPEGTRTTDGKMHAFKKGAFSVAKKAKVPIVPVTLIGTGRLMKNGKESLLRPGRVTIVVHPPIKGDNADELCKKAREVIASRLPPSEVAPA
eukprot:jgi/Chlat1/2880/Chrsp195S08771